jgi:hypothetical protein
MKNDLKDRTKVFTHRGIKLTAFLTMPYLGNQNLALLLK